MRRTRSREDEAFRKSADQHIKSLERNDIESQGTILFLQNTLKQLKDSSENEKLALAQQSEAQAQRDAEAQQRITTVQVENHLLMEKAQGLEQRLHLSEEDGRKKLEKLALQADEVRALMK